jgi:hypothetical protein
MDVVQMGKSVGFVGVVGAVLNTQQAEENISIDLSGLRNGL